jgi:hypothetical protein
MADEQRRARKTFEPPPWEKEAFDALAARRAEQDEAASAMAAVAQVSTPVREAPEQVSPEDLAAQLAAAMKAKAAGEPVEATVDPADTAAEGEQPATAPAAEDKLLEVMMLELAQEERSDNRNAKVIAWVASGITAVLGLGMVVAGLVLAAKANGQGSAVMGSAVLTVFGLIFAGMAAWVWISSNRVRGR